MMPYDKFVVTPKKESVTITVRIKPDLNDKLEYLSRQSNRSRNELINKALEFVLDNQLMNNT